MRPLDGYIKEQLNKHGNNIEELLYCDCVTIISPILHGLDLRVRDAVESIQDKKSKIVIILDTPGGIVEVVERMVVTVRHFYKEVIFIIPDRAMSAGTIFALSGNRILMDYFSCLGPIDPQIEKDGVLVPALAYLNQFDKLNQKAENGTLTSAEYALLSKMDLGELYQFEQARELSRELLIKWLSQHKFKDWTITETMHTPVDDQFKVMRAAEIADLLSNNQRWHSHGRGIDMRTLTSEINLKIEDYAETPSLGVVVKEFFELLKDYMAREKIGSFVLSKGYF